MARGLNKVMLIGNVGRDPEQRFLTNGSAVTNLAVATSEQWKDKETGQKQERTEWHNITIFGKLADIASQYVRKGSKVYVEGSLRTRKWQDKEGNDRYTTEIIASDMQMLDRAEGGERTVMQTSGGYTEARLATSDHEANRQLYGKGGKPDHARAAAYDGFEDEDVPF